MSDRNMIADERMKMERCLTQNFLLKFGMDIFGKRDLLYIDMRGNEDIAKMYNMDELPTPRKKLVVKAGGDDEAGEDAAEDAGDDAGEAAGDDAGGDDEE